VGRKSDPLSQYVSDPPEEKQASAREPVAVPAHPARARLSRMGIVALFVLIGLSLFLFTGQIVLGLVQTSSANAAQQSDARQSQAASVEASSAGLTPAQGNVPTPTATPNLPFFTPNNTTAPALQLAADHYVMYQTSTHIYLVSTTDNTILPLYTPDYQYDQAARPLLTPGGQLLYTGSRGIWITDVFDQQPSQIATLDPDTIITSLALSQDGKVIAWSTEPADGVGQITIYAGPLSSPRRVLQQSSLDCPCFRIFAFLNGGTPAADSTLLLTDDRGSNEALQYGLWSLDISNPAASPQLMMSEESQQGPLALVPYSNILLYSPYEGAVPVPTDGSVPPDVAALSYADSLSLATLSGSAPTLSNSQVVLAGRSNLAAGAQNRWVTTPTFSPDGHTLAYVEFSSDTQDPYDRHSAVYTVQIGGSGTNVQIGHLQLISTTTTRLLELGPWLNSHVVTMYGDGSIYALDVQSGALTSLGHPGGYVRILAVMGTGLT
jgi:hypothetical protein